MQALELRRDPLYGVGRGEIGLQGDASHAILSAKGVGEVLQRIDPAGGHTKAHAAARKLFRKGRTQSLGGAGDHRGRTPVGKHCWLLFLSRQSSASIGSSIRCRFSSV